MQCRTQTPQVSVIALPTGGDIIDCTQGYITPPNCRLVLQHLSFFPTYSNTMANLYSGGVYRLVNAKAGNVADLSGGDNTSVIGFDWHGGDNQKVRPRRCVIPYACR